MDSTRSITVNGGIDDRCSINSNTVTGFEWVVPVGHGLECRRWGCMGRQFGHDRSHRVWDRCQRLERIQALFYQDGHVSIRLHDYEKTLIELRSYVRGLPMEGFDGFLIKMQTLDDNITDLTPPTNDKLVKQYEKKFHHQPVTPQEHELPTSPVLRVIPSIMPKRTKRRAAPRRTRRRQKGGIFPLAALLPALIAGDKAVALGAASGGASYGAKKALEAVFRKKKKRRKISPREMRHIRRTILSSKPRGLIPRRI